MIVLVDIDGVLNNFQEHVIYFIEKLGYNFDYKYMINYKLEQGIQHKNWKKIFSSIMADSYFWLSIPVQEGAYEGLMYLNNTYDTYIATTPWSEKNKPIKKEWIKKNFPFFNLDKIIFSEKKWLLHGDIIIEDKPETIQNCNDHDMITIRRYQTYNINTHSDYTLYNWDNIQNIIQIIEKEKI